MKTLVRSCCWAILLLTSGMLTSPVLAQSYHPGLIPAGTSPGLPKVVINDNRTPGGTYREGVLDIDLVIVEADWRIETEDGPGIRLMAIAERGKAPSIPAPLIRVEEGTRIKARVTNSYPDSTITVYGFISRPQEKDSGVELKPGESHEFDFLVGEAGTYFYYLKKGLRLGRKTGEYEQLAGAFIVDPPGGSPPDRIFVINIYNSPVIPDEYLPGRVVGLTINGLSWPYTERIEPSVGDTLRWRIINASKRGHPMHLHGFYYDVLSRGGISKDEIYSAENRRSVVTELMDEQTTISMEWIPRREGNWLFHCHLSFHVSPDIRLPTADQSGHDHMAGLVLGINVKPGPSDLISVGEPKYVTLHANEFSSDSLSSYAFSIVSDQPPGAFREGIPGPLLLLKKHQSTFVTVKNHMSIPTGVHWHGLEIDSWSDGVPIWSASNGMVSPIMEPGAEFTYKLSAMRSGTFMYHSHLNDIPQLAGGLYGPMIVLEEGEVFDPVFDHIYSVGWKVPLPSSIEEWDLNGTDVQPNMTAHVGESHRLRLISIGPASVARFWATRNGEPFPLRAYAKDGADLPLNQQVEMDMSPFIGAGETMDYLFTPDEPGTYVLGIGSDPTFGWSQTWTVLPVGEE